MINIIKSGKNKEIKETTCDKCNCQFSFSREDCYWDRALLSYIVECPECNQKISLGDIFED